MASVKPPLLIEEMTAHLRDDHKFTIADENQAKKYLQTIGYYRLSGYAIPFYTDPTRSTAINGASFEDILNIYIFDRKLRILIIEALERIEIALRATHLKSCSKFNCALKSLIFFTVSWKLALSELLPSNASINIGKLLAPLTANDSTICFKSGRKSFE